MTRLTTRIAAAVGAIVVAGSMTGCVDRPSTAATVGTTRITVAEVDESVRLLPEGQAHPAAVLSIKMMAAAAEQVAARQGIPDLRARAERAVAQERLRPEFVGNRAVLDLATGQAEVGLLVESLGEAGVQEEFARLPVRVNPRYGFTGLEPLQQLRNSSLSLPAADSSEPGEHSR